MPVIPNKFHGDKPGEMDIADWERHWKMGTPEFHLKDNHPFLVKHLDVLLNGRKGIRIFFPMCGKAVDMKWLYDLGHTIIGVDGSQIPLEEFFKENDIEYTIKEADHVKGKLYESADKRVCLYLCDIFDFSSPSEAPFDAIWDRGGFGAINKKDRARYASMMMPLIGPNCRYLMDTFSYDDSLFIGPPMNVSEEDLNKHFGSRCEIKLLETVDRLSSEQAAHGMDKGYGQLWLLTLK